jgi:protein-S-isoprenylcysteine O-methyltransferase Ste14
MVPAAAVIALIDMVALIHRPGGGAAGVLRVCGTALALSFYLLIIWCYLRRRPAVATSVSVTAHVAAVTATVAPFAFPLLPARATAGRQLAGDLLLVTGLVWSLWALRSLGRSLSVLAQARQLVEHGPYQWVRHPLYAGEIVSSLGLAIMVGTAAAGAVWLAMCVLQAYRAIREEQVLLRALPGYQGYRSRTAALLPGLF